MKQKLLTSFSLFACIIIIASGCKTSLNSLALKDEDAKMKVQESPDALSYNSIKTQQVLTFTQRSEDAIAKRGSKSRGLVLGPLLGSAVSLGTDMVKKMIAKEKAKYIANYNFGLTDLYFYDQLSTESVFDPVGLQFSGFTLVRTFTNKNGLNDTAFIARFDLDTSSTNEIINNSIFRLKLKDFKLYYSKAKMTAAQKNTINMDIEISFRTTYVNQIGQLFDNVELGKFYMLVRNAPMDKSSPGYDAYYENMKGKKVDGRSFIVPRSSGYYKDNMGNVAKSYSQGAYSIAVKVTESSKDKFVTKILVDNSDNIINMLGKEAKKALTK
ncbi:MAG: hypothetical protein ABIO79_07230 [Ferruginibacter sp.]